MKVKGRLLAACFLAAGVAAAPFAASAQAVPEDRSSPVARETLPGPAITLEVQAQLAKDAFVVAKDIKVETDNNGVVLLTGTARNQQEYDRASLIARSVRGVVSVDNRIQLATER